MIYLPPKNVSSRAASWLNRWQNEVNALPTYAEQVVEAKKVWPLRNVGTNKTFSEVREVLASMAPGTVRCAYCEDSCADEIEHIQPKDLYPELVFAWANYLFACGKCNVEKRNNYAVFAGTTGAAWIDVKRTYGAPIVPPANGESLLINPRHENPLHFLVLDLTSAKPAFAPASWLSDREKERAVYTRDTLGLNARDELLRGRHTAFVLYANTLHRYVALKNDGAAAQDERDHCKAAIQNAPHATVWHEMKRWHLRFPGTLSKLDALFYAAPDTLTW